MKKSGPDYFNMNPLHGSSPAASLAADLSQNFHIDQRLVIPSFLILVPLSLFAGCQPGNLIDLC